MAKKLCVSQMIQIQETLFSQELFNVSKRSTLY